MQVREMDGGGKDREEKAAIVNRGEGCTLPRVCDRQPESAREHTCLCVCVCVCACAAVNRMRRVPSRAV